MENFQMFLNNLIYYFERNGDFKVPYEYVNIDGYPLGKFVDQIRFGEIELDENEAYRLKKLGFVKEKGKTYKFNFSEAFERIKEFMQKNPRQLIYRDYVTDDGYPLGEKVSQIRSGAVNLHSEEYWKLDEINFDWKERKSEHKFPHSDDGNKFRNQMAEIIEENRRQTEHDRKLNKIKRHYRSKSRFNIDEFIAHLNEYKLDKGHLNIPIHYVSPDGYTLGQRAMRMRLGMIVVSEQQEQALNDMGFVWSAVPQRHLPANAFDFDEYVKEMEEYHAEFGDGIVPYGYISPSGYKLGLRTSYLRRHSDRFKELIDEKLIPLGFVYKVPAGSMNYKRFDFDKFYIHLLEYGQKTGNIKVPWSYVSEDGYKLGSQFSDVRCGLRILTPQQVAELEEIGFIWNINARKKEFERFYTELLKYKEMFGNLDIKTRFVTDDGYNLGQKVMDARKGRTRLSEEQKERLEKIGFVFEEKKPRFNFEEFYRELLAYKEEKGNARVPFGYITPNGYKLGYRLSNVRTGYYHTSPQQKALIEKQGLKYTKRGIENFNRRCDDPDEAGCV